MRSRFSPPPRRFPRRAPPQGASGTRSGRRRPAPRRPAPAAPPPRPRGRPAAVETPNPEAEPVVIAPRPIVTASAGPVARGEPLPNSAVIERANAYFTGLGTLVADFTQVGGDGRRMGGTLYLQRPGKVRFEYDPPATLEVIADGRSVAV